MNNDLGRYFRSEMVLRASPGDRKGRTLYGTVVPYNETATVNDGFGPYEEMFAPGAFSRSLEQRHDKVKLFTQHDRSRLPVGQLTDWDEHDRGLDAEFFIPDHNAGNDVLALVSEGIVDSFSVGFRDIESHEDDGVTVRTEAALGEVSVVHAPAYAGAAMAGIRSKLESLDGDELAAWLATLPDTTRAQIDEALESTSPPQGHGAPDEAPPTPGHGTKRANAAQARLAVIQAQTGSKS